MSWLTSIEMPKGTTSPVPGVPVLPKKRPGIQTTIYRHEPGTREFAFNQDLEAPGAAARMEDRLGYNQQIMDAMQQAGGTFQNSPQYAGLAAQNDSGWKALNDRIAAEAAQSQAGTQADALAWEQSPEKFAQNVLGSQIQAGTASQQAIGQAGGSVNVPAAAMEVGLDKAPTLSQAIDRLGAQGKLPLPQGSPLHQALAQQFGPELAARQAGQPAHWYERSLPWFGHQSETNIGDVLQLGIPSMIRQAAGVPSWKQQGEEQVRGLIAPQTPATPMVRGPIRKSLPPRIAPSTEDRARVRNQSLEQIRMGQR